VAEPLILEITASDLASPALQKLQAEVTHLGQQASGATPGVESLSGATAKVTQQATAGASSATQLAQAVKGAGEHATAGASRLGDLSTSTGKAHASFLDGAKSALGFAASLTGVQFGLAAVGQVLQSTVSSVLTFESALANVNTLGQNSAEVQKQLRDQLLLLPPALGSSVELAKGLYDVLSAGVAPTKAVEFLAVSAQLAKAGLADMGSTTEALTKTMAAFNIPVEDAGKVANTFFRVVDLGQGTLQQFARAFPQVTQISATMGVSLRDTSAAMATLTQTFRNADTAATGYRSLLVQLIQNSDQFAAVGINMQKVAGEQGLAGVLRVLQELTGGNAAKMKTLVNDTEGLQAALALTGPQYKLFLDNQTKLGDSTDVVSRGFKLQSETVLASLGAMSHAFGTYVTTITTGNKETSLFHAVVNAFTQGLSDHTRGVIEAEAKAAAWRAEQEKARLALAQTTGATAEAAQGVAFLGNTYQNTSTYIDQYKLRTEAAQKAQAALTTDVNDDSAAWEGFADSVATAQARIKKEVTDATTQIQNELDGLNVVLKELKLSDTPKLIDAAKVQAEVDSSVKALQHLADSGRVNFQELDTAVDAFADVLEARFGEIPEAIRPAMAKIRDTVQAGLDEVQERGEAVPNALAEAFNRFGIQTQGLLQKTAQDGVRDFQLLLESGEGTTKQLLRAFHDTVTRINEGELKTLPDGLQAAVAQFAPILQKAGEGVVTVTRDAFGNVRLEVDKVGESVDRVRGKVVDLGHQTTESMAEATRAALGWNTILQRNYDSTVKLSEETQHLMTMQLHIDEKFASDVPGLLKQLDRQRDLQSLAGYGTTPADRTNAQSATQAIALILEKLAALGVNSLGQPLPGTGTASATSGGAAAAASGGTSSTSPSASLAAGGGGGSGSAGSPPPLGRPPPLGGATTRPVGASGTSPSLGSGGGSLVTGGNQGSLTTPGVPVTGTTVVHSPTINVHVNVPATSLSRLDAQSIVTQLSPALNEALQRQVLRIPTYTTR
jgi:TP901 family phage tail tape measure protein